jgi:hypothetical protein
MLKSILELISRIMGKIDWSNFTSEDLQCLMKSRINHLGPLVERLFHCELQLASAASDVDIIVRCLPKEVIAFIEASPRNRKLLEGVAKGTHEIKPIDHVIDLGSLCKPPFNGAERMSPPKSGIVKLERRDDTLHLDGKPINLFLAEGQKNGEVISGHDLRKELEARGGNLSANVLDHLVAHPELWPESWKKDARGNTVYVFFWDDIFRMPVSGNLYVRCGHWSGGEVVSFDNGLNDDWGGNLPAATTEG